MSACTKVIQSYNLVTRRFIIVTNWYQKLVMVCLLLLPQASLQILRSKCSSILGIPLITANNRMTHSLLRSKLCSFRYDVSGKVGWSLFPRPGPARPVGFVQIASCFNGARS